MAMTPKQEKEFCKAMTKRLHWYERLMAGEKVIWQTCRICRVFEDDLECENCPLPDCDTILRDKAMEYIEAGMGKVTAVKRHYNDLIRKIKKAGFEYK